jgi:Putative esterase
MLNKLTKRLLLTSIPFAVSVLTMLMTIPLNAQLAIEKSVADLSSFYDLNTISICQFDKQRCKKENTGTVVVLPASYDKTSTYPALIILPATYSTPASYINGDFAEQYKTRTENQFIIILLPVEGKKSDWEPDENFAPATKRYEKLIKSNLDSLKPNYNISVVALAGSSLGGDLSWLFSLRNPDLFRGSIVINSQSLEPVAPNMVKLATNKSRFVLISSEVDTYDRLPCMRNTAKRLADNGLTHWFGVVPGTDFSPSEISVQMLMPSIDYVLFNKDFDRRSWDHLTRKDTIIRAVTATLDKPKDPLCIYQP